jgi:hypothetical protein
MKHASDTWKSLKSLGINGKGKERARGAELGEVLSVPLREMNRKSSSEYLPVPVSFMTEAKSRHCSDVEPIHDAAAGGDLERLKEILKSDPLALDRQDEFVRIQVAWFSRLRLIGTL